jgi:L-iditol 2-dehydrogenase
MRNSAAPAGGAAPDIVVTCAELVAPRRVRPGERRLDRLAPGEARLRVLAVGICGSDLHLYRHGGLGAAAVEYPFVLGHEAVARVEEVADESLRPLVGRRVSIEPTIPCRRCALCLRGDTNLCLDHRFPSLPPDQGLLRERLSHPAHLLEPVPDELSDAAAALLEPLAIALHGLDLLKARPGESLAVLGCGGLGLLSLVLARRAGLGPLLATDPLAHRREAAREAGADVALEPGEAHEAAQSLTGGLGFDHVVEASGDPAAQAQSAELARPGGRIAVIGTTTGDHLVLPSHPARRKGLTILMVRRSRHTLARTCRLVAEPEVARRVESVVSHRVALAEAGRAFELAADYADGARRVVIVP